MKRDLRCCSSCGRVVVDIDHHWKYHCKKQTPIGECKKKKEKTNGKN